MTNTKIIAGISCVALLVLLGYKFLPEKEATVKVKEEPVKKEEVKPAPVMNTKSAPIKVEALKKYDLYSSTPYEIPLVSVYEISKLPKAMKLTVDKTLEEAQGIYFLKFDKSNNKVFAILQNPVSEAKTFSRHELEIAEISADGSRKIIPVGYTGGAGEIDSAVEQKGDFWEFDKSVEPPRPLKHVAYDEEGNLKFTEIWNYDEDSSTKYEMKNSDGKILSILKESKEGDSNYRKEHIFYDDEGKTVMSVSANYDGADISRFTYYNSEDDYSVSIVSEYSDGVKTEEKIYDEDYKLVNTLKSDYENGERMDIRIYDSDGKEVNKISS